MADESGEQLPVGDVSGADNGEVTIKGLIVDKLAHLPGESRENVKDIFSSKEKFIQGSEELGAYIAGLPEGEEKEKCLSYIDKFISLSKTDKSADDLAAILREFGVDAEDFDAVSPLLEELGHGKGKIGETGTKLEPRGEQEMSESARIMKKASEELRDGVQKVLNDPNASEADKVRLEGEMGEIMRNAQAAAQTADKEDEKKGTISPSPSGQEVKTKKLGDATFWFFFYLGIAYLMLLRLHCGGLGKQGGQ